MTTLKIDAANKKVTLDLQLQGESELLHVTIDRYEVSSKGGATY